MLFSELYSDIANDFNNWVQAEGSSYTADLALRYLNRAQNTLWMNPVNGWDYLIVDRVALTIGTDLVATLPDECRKVIAIYVDMNADGKPKIYYYKDGRIMFGFRFTDTYSAAAGHAFSVKFFYSPIGGTAYLRYQKTLPDFTGTGNEYSFFPGELLLLCAQVIRTREKGMIQEYSVLDKEYRHLLKDFKQQHQHNCEEISVEINDANGTPIIIPTSGLAVIGATKPPYGFRNDMDRS
jgi:hypothetical protein